MPRIEEPVYLYVRDVEYEIIYRTASRHLIEQRAYISRAALHETDVFYLAFDFARKREVVLILPRALDIIETDIFHRSGGFYRAENPAPCIAVQNVIDCVSVSVEYAVERSELQRAVFAIYIVGQNIITVGV